MDETAIPGRFYREIFEQVADALLVFEVSGEGRPGRFIEANRRAVALFGLKDDLENRTLTDISALEGRLITQEAIKRLVKERSLLYDVALAQPGGTLLEVEVRLSLTELENRRLAVAVIHEVGQARSRQRMLQKSEDLFRALAENSPFAITLYDERLIYANPAFERLSGYLGKELATKRFESLFLLEDRGRIEQMRQRRLAGEHFLGRYETRLITREGAMRNVRVYEVTIHLEGKNAVLTTLWDITDQKLLEASLERERKERLQKEQLLMQQSRFAAMGQMIAAVAHQWKQPLSAVSLLAQTVIEEAEDTAFVKETGQKLLDQVAFMNQTLTQFSNFFRQRGEAELFDLRRIVREVLDLLSARLKSDGILWQATVEKEGETQLLDKALAHIDHDFMALGYPGELKQVVLNLVTNAKEAVQENCQKNGVECKEGVLLRIAVRRLQKSLQVRIADQGGGVADGLRNRIFEPYFTTKGEKGTGIGLYIAREIVAKRFGGSLWFEPIEGGSEFIIDIPIDKKVES
ncbi:MAG: PAS domain S-box protein [Campylobacterales bacterium]